MSDKTKTPEALTSSEPQNVEDDVDLINPELFAKLANKDQTIAQEERDAIANQLVEKMFELYRARLLRMIEVRLPQELRARVEASDVLQESFIEAYQLLIRSNPDKDLW